MKTLKELQKEVDARVQEDVERDEEGRIVLELTVRSDAEFLSDYSVDRPLIASDLADFLSEQTSTLSPREPLLLKIYSNCIDEGEKTTYAGALREYALNSYRRVGREMRRNSLISFIMLGVGILGLIAVVLLSVFGENPVFSEILDIFAWVFVWEAVDLFFLERGKLRGERLRALRLYDAKIDFLPLKGE